VAQNDSDAHDALVAVNDLLANDEETETIEFLALLAVPKNEPER